MNIALLFIICLAGAVAPGAEPRISKGGDLETAMSLLKEDQVDAARRSVYAAAYEILAASPGATFAELGNHAGFLDLCREHGITHLGGPMLGDVTADGATVWVRTLRPAAVEVRVAAGGGKKTFGPVRSTRDSDLAAVVPVTGLEPATSHPYEVLIDGKAIVLPGDAVLTTAPVDGSSQVRIAFGSCPHRWGLNHQQQSDRIRSRRPSALLLHGDIAVQDRRNHLGGHRADYLLRDFQPAWQGLVASIPVYATWDDHDYFANDQWGIPKGCTAEDRWGVREVFRRAWNNPSYGFGDERGGVFLRTRIGPCDVILVDNRSFRTGEKGSFLGDGQMRWLEAQLLDCQGPFIILTCGTMWSDYVSGGKDSWGKWDPDGRERLFQLIERHRIPGVLLVSGDRHGARGFTIPRPSGYQFYEFEPASLGGRSGPPATRGDWSTQLFGISGEYAFGEFTIDATLADPEVTMRLVGADDGKTIYGITLKRSQLTPPATAQAPR